MNTCLLLLTKIQRKASIFKSSVLFRRSTMLFYRSSLLNGEATLMIQEWMQTKMVF